MRNWVFATMLTLIAAATAGAQGRTNIMYDKPVPGGPTYGELAEQFFAQTVFPAELSYKGVGLKRDDVITERIETNGRGGYWVSVRARYSGKAGVVPIPVAERAHVHYDNGGVRVDLGGMKGALNTKAVGKWVADRLPKASAPGPGPSTTKVAYTIKNESGRTVRFTMRPSGKNYSLAAGMTFEGTSSQIDGKPPTITLTDSGRTYTMTAGDHKFWWMAKQNRVGFDRETD